MTLTQLALIAGLTLASFLVAWAVITGRPPRPGPRSPHHAKWTRDSPTQRIDPEMVRRARERMEREH